MIEQPVMIPRADEYLVADLCPGGSQAILILPGWGGTRYGPQRILVQAAETFAGAGFTTLRLDFYGRGDSPGSPSAATLDSMIADTLSAVDWLRHEHHITCFNFVGLCSGGNVALGTASLLPADVDHVICWSLLPFMEHKNQAAHQGTDRTSHFRHLLAKALRPDSWRKLFRGEANVQGAMKVLARDKEGDAGERQRKTSQRDILADLTAMRGTLHLLYGSRDPEAAGSQAFFTDWCREHRISVDVHVIAGAPHNYYTAHWTQQVIEQSAAWLCG